MPIEFVIFNDHIAAESALISGDIDLIGGLETQQITDRMLYSNSIGCFDRVVVSQTWLRRQDIIGLQGQTLSIAPELEDDVHWLGDWLPPGSHVQDSASDPAELQLISEVFGTEGQSLILDSNQHSLSLYKRLVFFAVRHDQRELMALAESAWDQINKAELQSIEATWLPASTRSCIFQPSSRLSFTPAEIEFLKKHPIIHLGASPWEPLTIVDPDGNHSGIALDLLTHHLLFLGVTPVFGGEQDWFEVSAKFEAGEFDGLGYAVPNADRRSRFSLSDPYVYAPLVVVTRENHSLPDNAAGLAGKRFGLARGFTAGTLFTSAYPGTSVVEFPNRRDAARALQQGEIDGWLEIAPTARKVAADLGIDSFEISFRTELMDGMSLVLDNNLEPLCPMFNRATACTSDETISAIYAKYEPVFQDPNRQTSWLWLVAGLSVTLLAMSAISFRLIGAVRNSRKQIRVNERKLRHAQRVSRSGGLEIESSGDQLRMIAETYRLFSGAKPSQLETTDEHCDRLEPTSSIQFRQALKNYPGGQASEELELKLKSGEILRYHFAPLDDESGKRLITIQDVTDQVRRDQERARLNEKISQLKKLEALGNLAGGIAHDFNNILTASIVYNELALNSIDSQHNAHRLMSDVLSSSLRARDLVGQILSFSSERGVAEETVELNEIARESLQLVKPSTPPHITLELQPNPDSIELTANSVKLMQVLINLLSNAIQAMPGGGTIKLEIGRSGSEALIKVTDQGRGIPDELHEKIFEPFFTTRPGGSGTGMGLAIVHNIVRSLSGEIQFESGPAGTTFVVGLPIESPMPRQQNFSDALRAADGKDSTRIIVVDDEPAVLDVVLRVLKLLGYSVTGFTDPHAALDQFRQFPQEYDLLLTDMVMPGLSGMELLESIRSVRGDFPAVVCSGYDLENEFAIYPHLRRSVIQLNKPITSKSLAKAINHSLTAAAL